MPDGVTDAIEWFKTNPKVFVPAAIFLVIVGMVIGRWFMHAEKCHVEGTAAFEGVAAIQRSIEDEALRKKAANEAIVALCDDHALPDKPVTCARARASVSVEASK